MREQKTTTKDKDGKKGKLGKKCTLRTTNYTEKNEALYVQKKKRKSRVEKYLKIHVR